MRSARHSSLLPGSKQPTLPWANLPARYHHEVPVCREHSPRQMNCAGCSCAWRHAGAAWRRIHTLCPANPLAGLRTACRPPRQPAPPKPFLTLQSHISQANWRSLRRSSPAWSRRDKKITQVLVQLTRRLSFHPSSPRCPLQHPLPHLFIPLKPFHPTRGAAGDVSIQGDQGRSDRQRSVHGHLRHQCAVLARNRGEGLWRR